jgi:hypothetical protein
MADFTTSYIDSAPSSPITPQQAVVDKSGLIGLDFLSRAIDAGASTTVNYLENQRKIEAQQALDSAVADFATTQLKLADAVDQGAMSSQEARMRMRKNYTEAIANNPALAGELAKAQKDIVKNTGFGKIVEEGTDQEQIQLAAEKEATLAGWIKPHQDRAGREQSVQAYLQFKRSQDMLAQEQARVSLETAKINQGTALYNRQSSRIGLMQKERAERSRVALGSVADAYGYKFSQDLDEIKARVDRNELSREEAVMLADQQFSVLQQATASIGADAGGDYISNLTAPMKSRYDNMRKFLTGEMSAQVLDNQNQITLGLQKANLLGDPEVAKVVATSNLLPNASTSLLPALDKAVVGIMNKQSNPEGKNADLTPDDDEGKRQVKAYLDILKDNMKGATGGTLVNKGVAEPEIDTNISNVLKSVDAYSMTVENPAEYNQIVDFLASPEFGKYTTTRGGIPADAAHNAKQVLQQQYEQQVLPLLRERYEDVKVGGTGVNPGPRGGGAQFESAATVIKPLFTGAGVSFVVNPEFAKNTRAKLEAQSLNREVAPVLNRLIRMSAHLGGTQDYKAVYEQNYAEIFGEELPQGYANENVQ